MDEKINPKSKLLLILSKQQGEFLSNDSEFKIISNYEELMKIIWEVEKNPNGNIFEFIYSYKKVIHNYILYKEEKTINIDEFKLKIGFSQLYYLYLLIIEEEEIINYEYSFDFVKKIYEFLKEINLTNNKLLKIVSSKIVIEIINNFCETDNYDEDINGKDIERFKIEIDKIIKNNLDIFKKLNLDINEDKIESFKVNDIICDFIISLIKQNKFENYDYVYSFLDEIDLENIKIGKQILNRLNEVLDKKNDYMKAYIIDSKDHLYDESRINFYYILFKFILKDPIYIYQIDFLIETRNIILKIIRSHKFSYDNLNNANLERLKFVLQTFAGSKYFFQNSDEIKNALSKLKEVLTYYQFYFFETKKKEIEQIKEHIKKQNIQSEYLSEYERAKEENNAYPLIKEIYYIPFNKEIKSENELNNNYENWKTICNTINDEKGLKKLKKKEILYNLFIDENKKEMMLKVFSQEKIDSFIKRMKLSEKDNKKKDESAIVTLNKKDNNETMEAPDPTKLLLNQNQIINNKNDNKVKINGIGLEINQKKEEKHLEHNSSKESSTKSNSSSSSFGEKIGDNEQKQNKQKKEFLDVNKPKPKNNFSNLASSLLNKCSIDLSVKKNGDKNIVIINEVTIGPNNLKIKLDKFSDYLNSSMQTTNIKDPLADNSYRFANFINDFEERIVNEFNNNFYLNLKIEIKNTNKPNSDNSYNLEAIYTFYQPLNNKPLKYIEDNILIYGTESNLQGFNFMIEDLNQERFRNVIYKEDNFNEKIKILEKEEKKDEKNPSLFSDSTDINKKANDETILEIIKIIESKNNYNGFITELNNGFFVYAKNDNSIVIIDNKYNPVVEIKDYGDKIINVCEMLPVEAKKNDSKKTDEEYNLQFVSFGNKQLYLTELNTKSLKYKIKQLDVSHLYSFSCNEMKKNNFFVIGKNMASYYTNLFTNSDASEYQIKLNKQDKQNKSNKQNESNEPNKSYFNSIRINENVAAITSNSLFPNGDDILNFLNVKKRKLLPDEIKGYSFIISQNGLEIMPKNDKEKNKILLCACKKYTKYQENGILLVNPNLGDNKQLDKPFYNTGDIEIHCFCPILIINNENINKDTNYFLVGGFDQSKRKGVIQLYKTHYGKKAFNTTIEYIQDIKFKNKKNIEGFNGPINCIKQSKTTGNILVCCYNGNIYLLTPPNIDYYLKEDIN